MRKYKSSFAVTALVVAAAAASLVFALPLLSAVFGVEGFAAAGFLARWRLVLLGLSWGLLALGFYLAHRSWREARGQPNANGQAPHRRWNHIVLRLAAALVVVGSTLPYFSGWITPAITWGGRPVQRISKTATSRVVLRIA